MKRYRVGGRLGISDITAGDHADPRQLAEAEQRAGCTSGTLTRPQYRNLLQAAGFTSINIITTTHDVGGGLRSAIIQAAKPAARQA